MNFSDPGKVLATISAGDDAAWIQSENRRRINEAANGNPPLTDVECKQLNVRINVNWGEFPVAFAHARRQYDTAILGQRGYFTVSIPKAPPEKQTDWGVFITNEISSIMKAEEAYAHLKESQVAALVAHGIGPQMWYDKEDWLPQYIDIQDLRVPTDTEVSFRNLEWFAVRHRYTPGELVAKVWNKNGLKGWDQKSIAQILKTYKEINYGDVTYDWETNPEAMAELVKQNFGYYSSDAVPTISLWHFYYLESKKWYMCVVPDTAAIMNIKIDSFLYQNNSPIAEKLCYLLHVQFGDLNNKAPFLYHSVRSLGFLLMEPCFWTNITRCRLLQHAHESMNAWYRVTDPAGRARAQKIELFDRSIVPEGVSVVPQTERHQIDPNLIEQIMSQLKQLQNEASVSYTQQIDTGTQKEQTATETMANVQRVNAMMSGLLGRFFRREIYAYKEICRRLCLPDSMNEDAKKFQKACLDYGIPRQFLDVKMWDLDPDIPMGSGNPTMAVAEAQQMLQMRPMFDPTVQQEILHDVTAVFTGNVRKASRWVPLDKERSVSDAEQVAAFTFGVLMQGVPAPIKEGLSLVEQAQTLIGLLAAKVNIINGSGGMTDMPTIIGLQMVGNHIAQLLGMVSENPQEKERVKQFSDVLKDQMNYVKAFQQRLQQQMRKAGQPGNGEAAAAAQESMAKLQGQMQLQQAKAKATELNAEQKRRHKEVMFMSEQKRKDASTQAEIERQNARAVSEIGNRRLIAANQPKKKTNES